jgi:hypothetical protein
MNSYKVVGGVGGGGGVGGWFVWFSFFFFITGARCFLNPQKWAVYLEVTNFTAQI